MATDAETAGTDRSLRLHGEKMKSLCVIEDRIGGKWTGATFHHAGTAGFSGCPDSRKYGGIEEDLLVVGVPSCLVGMLLEEERQNTNVRVRMRPM